MLKAFVNGVKPLICIRIVNFWRSTMDVRKRSGSGLPMTETRSSTPLPQANSEPLALWRDAIDLDNLGEVYAIAERRSIAMDIGGPVWRTT